MKIFNVKGEEVLLEEDWAAQAQRAAEEHLAAVWADFNGDEEEGQEVGDSPAIGAFDGCATCEVREVLYASMPFIEAGLAREGGSRPRPLTVNLIACPQEEDTDV